MTPAHRAPEHRTPRVSRRGLLGFGALAVVVPAGAFLAERVRERSTLAPATGATPTGPDVPAATTPSVVAGPKVVTSGGGAVPYRNGKVLLGTYLSLDGMSAQQAQALRHRQLGRDPRIVHLFYGWTDSLPRSIPYLPAHAVPMISWRGTGYAAILNGSSDDLIARAARNLRALGRPTLLRWAWEMNGDWYAWGGARNGQRTADFVKCWQRLHRIFADQGATNVSWVFSVNWNNSPAESWNEYQDYYPGDKYVDWVGSDGYNLHHETPDTLFGPIYTAYAAHKPIIISEVGAVDRGGRTKADWIALFADWVTRRPAVGAVAWFDTDTHPTYHEEWRIDSNPEALAAYRAMALAPRFAG